MYVEMVCGPCECVFNCDAEDDEASALWMMMHRFATAHSECGYMASVLQADDVEESPTARRKIIKPRLKADLEEDSEGA